LDPHRIAGMEPGYDWITLVATGAQRILVDLDGLRCRSQE